MTSEIVELTRGHIKLKLDDRTVTIEGEMLVRAPGIPDFVAYSDTVTAWEPPHENEPITIDERKRILEALLRAGERRNLTIEIE